MAPCLAGHVYFFFNVGTGDGTQVLLLGQQALLAEPSPSPSVAFSAKELYHVARRLDVVVWRLWYQKHRGLKGIGRKFTEQELSSRGL